MKEAIARFIRYPVLGHVLLVAIFLFGWIGFRSLKTTFFPIMPSRTIIISALYLGASPEEIEEAIVLKIEDNLKGLTGVERVTSVSNENSCRINVTVLAGYDVNILLQDVQNAVNQVSTFPSGMERLTIFRQEMRNFAIDFVLSGDVVFASGSATLTYLAGPQLRAVAAKILQDSDTRYYVDGHTDAQGEALANYQLSLRRAAAVRDALIRFGVPTERLLVRGFGEESPVASNATAAGRRANRRVEIVLPE